MRRNSEFGWAELILGIGLIALGVITFVRPGSMVTGITVIYGIAAVLMGIADIVIYIKVERFVGFTPLLSLISGIMSVMCGIMVLAYPRAGQIILSLLIPIWFIAHCTARLSFLTSIRRIDGDFYYYFSLVINVIGILLGVFLLFCPTAAFGAVHVIECIAAVYLILLGTDCVAAAFEKRNGRY